MTDLTPRVRSIIYIAALLALIALAIAGILTKSEAMEYVAYIAGALGLGTAVQYRPTLTASERDRASAITDSATALVGLHRAEAPVEQIDEAVNALGGKLLM